MQPSVPLDNFKDKEWWADWFERGQPIPLFMYEQYVKEFGFYVSPRIVLKADRKPDAWLIDMIKK
jgi:hypothetical protein|tara:strand:+ start:174 stop:368 length:195 start_codon:yes stop_codon:yes gene_type:complete